MRLSSTTCPNCPRKDLDRCTPRKQKEAVVELQRCWMRVTNCRLLISLQPLVLKKSVWNAPARIDAHTLLVRNTVLGDLLGFTLQFKWDPVEMLIRKNKKKSGECVLSVSVEYIPCARNATQLFALRIRLKMLNRAVGTSTIMSHLLYLFRLLFKQHFEDIEEILVKSPIYLFRSCQDCTVY